MEDKRRKAGKEKGLAAMGVIAVRARVLKRWEGQLVLVLRHDEGIVRTGKWSSGEEKGVTHPAGPVSLPHVPLPSSGRALQKLDRG